MIAYPLLVLSLTGSPLKAGMVGFVSYLTPVVSLPAGWLADRADRLRIMILACIADAGVVSSIP
jgi:MFS family permease